MKFLSRFHPVLFLISSLIYMFLVSSIIVAPGQLLRPFFVLLIMLLLLVFPAYWLARDWDWAAMLLSVLVIAFVSTPTFFIVICVISVAGFIILLALAYLRKFRLTSEKLSMT